MKDLKVPYEESLEVLYPAIAKEWHPTKNKMKPNEVRPHSHKIVWWLLTYDDPATGKHFDFVWEAAINSRVRGRGCPYLTGNKVWVGFNDLVTTHPELAAQWHPTLNGKLTPYDVSKGCNKKVWWLLPYDDPKTGKHFDFVWKESVLNRSRGNGCPFLSGRAVWVGFNDLATTDPELAAQWHPTKNGLLTPQNVTRGSFRKIWWFLPYDDTATGKHFDFVWKESLNKRTSGCGCPYLSGHKVWVGFNDLATTHPELAAQWHPNLIS